MKTKNALLAPPLAGRWGTYGRVISEKRFQRRNGELCRLAFADLPLLQSGKRRRQTGPLHDRDRLRLGQPVFLTPSYDFSNDHRESSSCGRHLMAARYITLCCWAKITKYPFRVKFCADRPRSAAATHLKIGRPPRLVLPPGSVIRVRFVPESRAGLMGAREPHRAENRR